jgi:hypothetical protein
MAKAKIKTFEAACKQLELDQVKCLPKVTGVPKHQQDAIIAHAKLMIIAEALNDGWKPDWKNTSENKYYPWFDLSSGSGLSYYDCGFDCSNSFVGSRLCFKSKELAEYAGKQFIKLYEAYFVMS